MKRFAKYVVCLALLIGTVVGLGEIGIARSSATPGNCQDDLWITLGSARRLLCDSDIQSDGSWMRHRQLYTSAHYVPSYCSRYSCTGGYYVDLSIKEDVIYPVRPETVLPDEPGHICACDGIIHIS